MQCINLTRLRNLIADKTQTQLQIQFRFAFPNCACTIFAVFFWIFNKKHFLYLCTFLPHANRLTNILMWYTVWVQTLFKVNDKSNNYSLTKRGDTKLSCYHIANQHKICVFLKHKSLDWQWIGNMTIT